MYKRQLANPAVHATIDGDKKAYTAVPIEGAEHDQVDSDNGTGVVFKILTGFPPRKFLRLDPV